MNSLVKVSLVFLLFTFPFSITTIYAQVYKCKVNGKMVYSDSRCAYEAEVVKINPNQNVISPDRSQAEFYQQKHNQDIANQNYQELEQNCANLLNKIKGLKDDRSLSFRDRRNNVTEKVSLRDKYEANCMSDENRQNTINKRKERNIERRLQTIEREHQADEFKKYGIGN